MYIWVLSRCEGNSLDAVISKCHAANITWLAVKAGDQGSRGWMPTHKGLPQFSKSVVDRLHAAGLKVFGWSYDVPQKYTKNGAVVERGNILVRQAQIVKAVADLGADGFIIDAETEWDRAVTPDADARAYLKAIKDQGLPDGFLLGDAPWAAVGGHPKFPTTEFGKGVDFRCPQALWVLGTDRNKMVVGPVDDTCGAYAFQWDAYEAWVSTRRKPPAPGAVKPHLTGGGLFVEGKRSPTVAEVAYFEQFMRDRGCSGVLYWEWSQVPSWIWTALMDGTIPAYGDQ